MTLDDLTRPVRTLPFGVAMALALFALPLGATTALVAPAAAQTSDQPGSAPAGQAPADQAAPPEAEISPSHLAAARAAIKAISATEQFDNILPNAATQVKSEFIPNNPDKENEISDMVDDRALKFASRRGDLENEIARIYARMFKEDELNQIAQFYTSEAGKKLLAQGPAATREMMQSAEVWRNGIVRDLRQSGMEGMNEIYGSAKPGDAAAVEGAAAPANGAAAPAK